MSFMLDTNICIYAIKKRPEVLRRIRENQDVGLCISSITLAELRHGVEKSTNPVKSDMALIQFLVFFDILPFDDAAAVEYGRVCAYLYKRGTPIGPMDMLIAAHARAAGMILVTNNTREFERVPGLTLENWAVSYNSTGG